MMKNNIIQRIKDISRFFFSETPKNLLKIPAPLICGVFFLLMVSSVSALEMETAFDDFECNAFNCGSGWIDTWTYTGVCEITTLSNPLGTYQLRGQNGCDVSRTINTSSANVGLNVSFYAGASGLETADFCRYYYYDGTSYESLLNLSNGDDDTTLRYYSYDMYPNTADNAEIRMWADASSGDYCLLDNVNVTTISVSPPVINITSSSLSCKDMCEFNIEITDELERTFNVESYQWFLYVPYLNIPFLNNIYPMTYQSSSTGYTTHITIDTLLEFGKNNYPRNELWITLNDGQSNYLAKSNIFTLNLNTEPTINVHGTEYETGQDAKVWLQLLDEYGDEVNDAICYLDIFTPDNSGKFVDNAQMSPLGTHGVYVYDVIAPSQQGVYPAIALCYYDAVVSPYNASSYYALYGSSIGGDYTSTNVEDSSDHTIREDNAGGNKRIDFQYNVSNFCPTFDENLLTSITIYTKSSWTSNTPNDHITAHIYNYTSNDWVALPNKILSQTAGYQTITNSLLTTNYTTSGLTTQDGGTIRIRFNDTAVTDNSNDNLEIDYFYASCDALADPQWTEVQGSSEMHVSAPIDTRTGAYTYSLDLGEMTNETFLNDFIYHYTIGSAVASIREDQDIYLTLHKPFPCEHIINVYEVFQNGSTENLTYVASDDTNDRCEVDITHDLEPNENYEFRIQSENWWKADYLRKKAVGELQYDMIEIACENYQEANGFDNYTIPLQSPPQGDNMYKSCSSYLDEHYHFDDATAIFEYFVDTRYNFTESEMKTLETQYLHMEEIVSILDEFAVIIFDGLQLANDYSLALISDPYPPTNPDYVKYFANISSSYLNYLKLFGLEVNATVDGNVSANINPDSIDALTRALTNETSETFIGGTDYFIGQTGDISVRLIRGTATFAQLETGASCYASSLYPNGTIFIDNQSMNEVGSGVYRYNFTIPDTIGVYTYYTDCTKDGFNYFGLNTFTVKNEGTVTYIGGTEYGYADDGKVAIRLFREQTQTPDTGASCLVSILNPDQSTFVGNASMTEQGFGVYYYDFTVPSIEGVYTYYTDCEISNRFYDGLSTFHVQQYDLNDIVSDLDALLSAIESNENLLTSITADLLQQAQFTDEQIYLITDAVTEIQHIKEDIFKGELTPLEGQTKIEALKQELKSNKAFQTPNEIYLDVVNGLCVAYITNEGNVRGEYEVTMEIEGGRKEVYQVGIDAQKTTQIGLDMRDLPNGEYYCSAESDYASGKSTARIKIHWDAKEGGTIISDNSFNDLGVTIAFIIIFASLILIVLLIKSNRGV